MGSHIGPGKRTGSCPCGNDQCTWKERAQSAVGKPQSWQGVDIYSYRERVYRLGWDETGRICLLDVVRATLLSSEAARVRLHRILPAGTMAVDKTLISISSIHRLKSESHIYIPRTRIATSFLSYD